MELEAVVERAPAFALYMVRVGALIAAVPFFGSRGDTLWPRISLTLLIALAFYLPRAEALQFGPSPLAWAVVAAREAIIGFGLGFALHSLLLMLRTVGEVLGNEMGFQLARVINPNTGESSAVMAQILEVILLLLFFAMDGHLACFRALDATFQAVPVGEAFDLAVFTAGLKLLLAESFHLAVSMAVPVVGVMLVVTSSLFLLARAVPQVNLLEMGYTLRILVAMAASVWFLDRIVPAAAVAMDRYFPAVRGLFST